MLTEMRDLPLLRQARLFPKKWQGHMFWPPTTNQHMFPHFCCKSQLSSHRRPPFAVLTGTGAFLDYSFSRIQNLSELKCLETRTFLSVRFLNMTNSWLCWKYRFKLFGLAIRCESERCLPKLGFQGFVLIFCCFERGFIKNIFTSEKYLGRRCVCSILYSMSL
jgi:hypothetical protein